jgi:serine protease Do
MLSKTLWPNAAMAACLAAGLIYSDAEAQTQRQRVNLSETVSYIGVNIQEITAERAKALKLKDEAGVDVTRVEPESPAEKAGIKAGDVITEFNSQHVEGIEQFSRMVRETPAGREVKLSILRAGAAQTIPVKIGSRHVNPIEGMLNAVPFNREPAPSNVMPDVPRSRMSWRSGVLGIEAESLSGQLADFFGVKDGILIRAVTRGGAADKAGMRAGDVIVKVADSKVATPSDVSTRLQVLAGKSTTVVIVRDKKEMTLTVNLDNDRASRPRNRAEVDERF